jgi:hypothetical protein
MTGIIWKDGVKDQGVAFAERNGFVIGYVVRKTSGVWAYRLDAFHTKWITQGYGEVASKAQAKKSFMRAWRACLETLGLEHKQESSDR